MTGFNSKRDAAADKLQEPVHSVQSNGRHSPLLTHMMNKRTASAQPAQEPDALTIAYQSGFYDGKKAAQRPWVGMTDEDIADCMEMSIQKTCRAVETKLKERNS